MRGLQMGRTSWIGLCAVLAATLCSCGAASSGSRNASLTPTAQASPRPLLAWTAARPLTWADFDGPVPADKRTTSIQQRFAAIVGVSTGGSSHEAAETVTSIDGISASYSYSCSTASQTTQCHITNEQVTPAAAFFDPNASWAISGDEQASLLAHEQGHFDIAEIYARRLDTAVHTDLTPELQAIVASGPDPTTAEANIKTQADASVHQVTASTMNAFTAAEQQYDDDTQHGTDASSQQQWLQRIRTELDAKDAS